MSDRMTPMTFSQLMDALLAENAALNSIFGIRKMYKAGEKSLELFGQGLELPLGPAAGPHTQLSQNIITAYVAGARFFELKTVQTLDGEDLPVSKPCILAADEGYNVEWSTELTVGQALGEYIRAWYALKLLSRELELGGENGFVFNMSVGYDYDGITSPKIDTFIESLKNAAETDAWHECREWTLANLSRFNNIDAEYVDAIDSHVCSSITLSTLHGCPPAEIERIASHLISQKKLNTFVKCNPTLLGYDFARGVLDELGYDYLSFDEHHFQQDLQFGDAIPMFKRLIALSAENGVEFGVKLTNTFPVEIKRGELPGDEMYMSGRALFPLTISLASELSSEFNGALRISFSGGADIHSVKRLFEAGVYPITMATTLLKTGGYQRLTQLAQALDGCEYKPFDTVNVKAVNRMAEDVFDDEYYKKPAKPLPRRRIDSDAPLLECFAAPCSNACPIHQDIPEYIRLQGQGKGLEALRVITEKNPLPFITGTICAHRCMEGCTRVYCDESVRIRDVKLAAAKAGFDALLKELKPESICNKTVAIVGAGACGLSAAFFTARAGCSVTVFDKNEYIGGVVRGVIPRFRIDDEAIDSDIELCNKRGVKFVLGSPAPDAADLLKKFDFVLYAVGAGIHNKADDEFDAVNALDFLYACKNAPETLQLGENVVIVGGGNTAMDAARAAKRVQNVKNVSIVYRRDRRAMPASEEELILAENDGVEFCELLTPKKLSGGMLTCAVTVLGEPDASGRRAPVETDETTELPCDTFIMAAGERADLELLIKAGIAFDDRKKPLCGVETSVERLFIGGDARRGPATVVEAIADAREFANIVTQTPAPDAVSTGEYASAVNKKGVLAEFSGVENECARCLECSTVCEACVDVCPNRANISLEVSGRHQILHIHARCNECGNCVEFCPYQSAPYKAKFTLYPAADELSECKNEGFAIIDAKNAVCAVRYHGKLGEYNVGNENCGLPEDIRALINTYLDVFGG